MDRNEWYWCSSTGPMLSHLREAGLLSSRKQVLLACASIGPASLQDAYYQLAARFVDGEATPADIDAARAALQREADADPHFWDRFHSTHADEVFRRRYFLDIASGRENVIDLNTGELPCHPFSPQECVGVVLIHELFGDPFRHELSSPPPAGPEWLAQSEADARQLAAWRSGNGDAVRNLARRIYKERAFDLMPALADALAAAGCDDSGILDHCRRWPLHVRGCWVIDMLLGKE